MADVFISYKREERPQVERLATVLRGLGFSVWFDARLSAGEAFTDEIDREVRTARVVLVCWSPAAAGSDFVKAEALIGFQARTLLSTFVAGPDGWSPPVPFNGQHTEDLRAWVFMPNTRSNAWKSVLRRLGVLTGRDDVADWGALPSNAEPGAIRAWVEKHGAVSPLVIEAENALMEARAQRNARAEAEVAARERLRQNAAEEREDLERQAAERRKLDAEAEVRASEARQAQKERVRSVLQEGAQLTAKLSRAGGDMSLPIVMAAISTPFPFLILPSLIEGSVNSDEIAFSLMVAAAPLMFALLALYLMKRKWSVLDGKTRAEFIEFNSEALSLYKKIIAARLKPLLLIILWSSAAALLVGAISKAIIDRSFLKTGIYGDSVALLIGLVTWIYLTFFHRWVRGKSSLILARDAMDHSRISPEDIGHLMAWKKD